MPLLLFYIYVKSMKNNDRSIGGGYNMGTIMIDVPPEIYKQLENQARWSGKSPELFIRELIEKALQTHDEARPRFSGAREVLQASGRVHPLSETLRRKIIRGVTLGEVRAALTQAPGPTLSEIILQQRKS